MSTQVKLSPKSLNMRAKTPRVSAAMSGMPAACVTAFTRSASAIGAFASTTTCTTVSLQGTGALYLNTQVLSHLSGRPHVRAAEGGTLTARETALMRTLP